MAIVTYGSGITNIVGSIGGNTFQNTAAGATLRRRPRQKANATSNQLAKLSLTGKLANLWQSLSLGEQDAYNSYASIYQRTSVFGRNKKLTGYQWFYSMNYPALVNSFTIANVPPAHISIAAPTNVSYSLLAGILRIIGNGPASAGHYYLYIRISLPTVNSNKRPTTVLRVLPLLASALSFDYDITALYQAATGINPATLPSNGLYRLYAEVSIFDSTSRLYSPISPSSFTPATLDLGIGAMAVGYSFIVR